MIRFLATLVLLALLAPSSAHAGQRIALLIGNKNYSREIGPLANPHNDVRRVAGALTRIGFKKSDIRILFDIGRAQIRRAVRAHARRVDRAGADAIGFFYYSGHGAADLDTRVNYLIPVDVTSRDEEVWDDSVPLSYIINRLQTIAPRAAHFVIFDACRNELQLLGRKAVNKGFVPEAARPGMLIAYSTDQGSTASDVGNGVGPYAKALVDELAKPGRTAGVVFDAVKFRVYRSTSQPKQLPWHVSKFTKPVILASRTPAGSGNNQTSKPRPKPPVALRPPSVTKSPPPSFERQAEIAFWNSVRESKDPVVIQIYLDQYPDGTFAPLARILVEKLKRARAVAALTAKQEEVEAKKRAAEEKREAERRAALEREAEDRRREKARERAARERRLERTKSKKRKSVKKRSTPRRTSRPDPVAYSRKYRETIYRSEGTVEVQTKLGTITCWVANYTRFCKWKN